MSEIYGMVKSIWLLWLVLLFIGIVAWVYWPGRKGRLEAHGRIPFEEEEGGKRGESKEG